MRKSEIYLTTLTSILASLGGYGIGIALGSSELAMVVAVAIGCVSSRGLYLLVRRIQQRAADRFSTVLRKEQAQERQVKALTEQSNEQEAIIACMIEAVVAFDRRGRIIRINRAAESLLHIIPDTAFGKSIEEVIKSSALQKITKKIIANPENIETEVTLFGTEETYVRVFASALRDSQGECFGGLLVMDDVTHLRKLENMRRDFVANVSHELRTPITSIKGFIETLLDGALEKPDDARRFCGIIARQADRLSRIFDDLLLLARLEQSGDHSAMMFESIDVSRVIQAAVMSLEERRAEKKISITIDCIPLLVAELHPTLMEQAVGNLIANAITYSEPEKTILVEGRLSSDRQQVIIRVHDQGCGIAKEHLPRIFERFYRIDKARSRKQGGTGLGLSIVKHIAYAHGGKLEVQSTVGKGSIFSIIFPLKQTEQESKVSNFD